MRDPEAPSQDGASSHPRRRRHRVVPGRPREGGPRAAVRGLWRVSVSERSMAPAVLPGDWLLVDPTVRRWPRRGSVVVFREPFTDVLAIKRVAARPGDWVPFADGWLQLAEDEAWLVGDATDEAVAAAGHGAPGDSRRYGPVPIDALVARAWFRYGPLRRVGRIAPAPSDLLARGRVAPVTGPTAVAPGEIAGDDA